MGAMNPSQHLTSNAFGSGNVVGQSTAIQGKQRLMPTVSFKSASVKMILVDEEILNVSTGSQASMAKLSIFTLTLFKHRDMPSSLVDIINTFNAVL